MAEYTSATVQTVALNQNVLFTETPVCGNCSVMHREGSGLVTLRGITNGQCRARFRIFFSGNIAIPTGGTVGSISLAISVDGEPLNSTNMVATPAAVEQYNNVASGVFVDVPRGCCVTIGVRNTSSTGEPILVANPNLIVERVA